MRTAYQPIDKTELESLIMWPTGTVGEREERYMLNALLRMADTIGYGRLHQLAGDMEDLWGHPERLKEYNDIKAAHIKQLTGRYDE